MTGFISNPYCSAYMTDSKASNLSCYQNYSNQYLDGSTSQSPTNSSPLLFINPTTGFKVEGIRTDPAQRHLFRSINMAGGLSGTTASIIDEHTLKIIEDLIRECKSKLSSASSTPSVVSSSTSPAPIYPKDNESDLTNYRNDSDRDYFVRKKRLKRRIAVDGCSPSVLTKRRAVLDRCRRGLRRFLK